jgi:hypothetical protein
MERTAHRLALKIVALRREAITSNEMLAEVLTERGLSTLRGIKTRAHTPRWRSF